MTASAPHRRNDLDALRVGAVYLLFVFHSFKVYDPRPLYHVWSADLIPGMQHVTAFVTLWHMPLLFFLAGWSAVISLHGRTSRAFVKERLQRLALPLIFGCALVCPIIKYLELKSGVWLGIGGRKAIAALQEAHGSLQLYPVPVIEPYMEPFLTFLPRFYSSLKFFTWSHLWFLAYLLVLTVAFAPLLVRLAAAKTARAKSAGAWLILPALALALSETLLRPHWPGTQDLITDWANVTRFAIYLLAGAIWATQPDFAEQARKYRLAALAAAVALFTTAKLVEGPLAASSVASFATNGLPAAAGWFVVLFLLGMATHYVKEAPSWLAGLSATAMAVYVLHQLGVALAAYWLDGLALPVALRLPLIIGVSTAGTLLVVNLLVTRSETLRAGFGLRTDAPAAWRAMAMALLAIIAGLSLRVL